MLNAVIWIAAIAFTVLAQILLKRGVQELGEIHFSLETLTTIFLGLFKNIYLFSGAALFGVSLILWIWLVSKMQLNILYPITVSIEVTLVAIATWFLFNETLTPPQILGMGAVVAGIFLLSWHA